MSDCYATGWGAIDKRNGTRPSFLQEVRLPILNKSYCEAHANYGGVKINSEQMICAGYESFIKGDCTGDSGGPLVCPILSGTWIQYGIASFAPMICGEGPTVFTKIAHYIDWIENNIND